MAQPLPVSPLAPPGGFPRLPRIGGVDFAAAMAGVKYVGRDDVMLARIAPGARIAGVFTRSATRAAPVLWCQDCLARTAEAEHGFAILVNSGNANAFTGENGVRACEDLARVTSAGLGIPLHHVFLASTGVIGEALPAERITSVIDDLVGGLSPSAAQAAARAIMTTDTFPKGAATQVQIGGKTVSIAGFAKGSGMIAPDMATMLAYVFTDANVSDNALQTMLCSVNERTFNSITVDSDTSTSDTVMLVATGAAQMAEVTAADSAEGMALAAALETVMRDLAHQIVRDGEGASKFVSVTVRGADSATSARRVAMAIGNSPLVKTAIAGEDPNWGRVVMAIGKAGEPADRDRIGIWFGDIEVARAGWVSPAYTEDAGATYMKRSEIELTVDLGIGGGEATIWTCDLTHQYITINADYRS